MRQVIFWDEYILITALAFSCSLSQAQTKSASSSISAKEPEAEKQVKKENTAAKEKPIKKIDASIDAVMEGNDRVKKDKVPAKKSATPKAASSSIESKSKGIPTTNNNRTK